MDLAGTSIHGYIIISEIDNAGLTPEMYEELPFVLAITWCHAPRLVIYGLLQCQKTGSLTSHFLQIIPRVHLHKGSFFYAMLPSRQERRRENKKKMQPKTRELSKNMIKLPLCYPDECTIDCQYKTFGKENGFHEYDEILKKYLLLSHAEKTAIPDENNSSIVVFSKVFCPPDTMVTFENEVRKHMELFFEEISIGYNEFGSGAGFFSACATIGNKKS